MKVALVQPYGDNYTYSLDELEEKLQHFLAKQPAVDLIVFPEAYEYIEHEKLSPWDAVRALGDKFQTAVIVGYSLDLGTEEAYYYNPNADEAQYETNFSFYIKHATAHRVMFEEALSEENIATIYAPVYLKGKHIQFSICHDMYYPLIMERFAQEGMDIYINLTGGNVKMSKWGAILKGRSVELSGPVLCTMGNRTSMRQASERLMYRDGKRIAPIKSSSAGKSTHAFSIFDLDSTEELEETPHYYSDKVYTAFTVGEQGAHIHLKEGQAIPNRAVEATSEQSFRMNVEEGTVHVHIGGEEHLKDRAYVFEEPRFTGDHELFIYFCDASLSYEDAISLAKLRAIENRIAVVIDTPHYRIGAKTNRYKDVQLFERPTIGFDLQHMYGFDSVYEKNPTSTNGLNVKYRDLYEALIYE